MWPHLTKFPRNHRSLVGPNFLFPRIVGYAESLIHFNIRIKKLRKVREKERGQKSDELVRMIAT